MKYTLTLVNMSTGLVLDNKKDVTREYISLTLLQYLNMTSDAVVSFFGTLATTETVELEGTNVNGAPYSVTVTKG